MPGVGLANRASAAQNISLKINAIIKSQIAQLSGAEVSTLIQSAEDLGLFEEEDMTVCVVCGRIYQQSPVCPHCGSTSDDADETDNVDEDLLDYDETSVSEDMLWNDEGEPIVAPDLAEDIRLMLRDFNWPLLDLNDDSLLLARIWDSWDKQPLTEQNFCKALAVYGIQPTLWIHKLASTLEIFKALSTRPTQNIQDIVRCVIHISEIGQVQIKPSLQDRNLNASNHQVSLGKGKIKLTSLIKNLENEEKKFQRLGAEIYQLRRNFFTATNRSEAHRILCEEALEQRVIAERLGVDASTISRWCGNPDIKVSSSHGVSPLSCFFKPAARVQGSHRTTAAHLNLIKAARDLCIEKDLSITAKEVHNCFCQQDYKINISQRTISRYLKYIDIQQLLPEVPEDVRIEYLRIKNYQPLRTWLAREKGVRADLKTIKSAVTVQPEFDI